MLFTKSYLKPFSDATKLSPRLWRSEVNRRSLPYNLDPFCLSVYVQASLVNGWVDICIFFSDAQPLTFLAEYHATWRHIHISVRSRTNISVLWVDLGVLRGDCPLPHPHPTPAFFRWNFALRRQYNGGTYRFPSDFIEINYNSELNCLSFLETLYNLSVWFMLRFIGGSEWGYLDNTKHLIFWFCNMKQLNFRYFNINSKKFFEIVNFSQKEAKTAPKRPILFCLVYQGVFGHFTTIPDYFRRFPKISEDSGTFPKTNEEVRTLPKMFEEPSKQLSVFCLETVKLKNWPI